MSVNSDNVLLALEKGELVKIIHNLKMEIEKKTEDFSKLINLRLYTLERSHFMHLQYTRRESFEVVGIPQAVTQEELEDEVVKITKDADVKVNRQNLKKSDIVACHRIGKKGNVVCRVINRKFAKEAVVCGKNLKGTQRYGMSKVFINYSLCPEYKFLNYACRQAARSEQIHRYKVKNGVNYVQVEEDGDWMEIGHVLDMENKGITVPPRQSGNKN